MVDAAPPRASAEHHSRDTPQEPGDRDRAPGLARLAREVVLSPSRAMEALARHPGRRWLVPVALASGLGLAAAIIGADARMEAARAQLDAQEQRMIEQGASPETIESVREASELGLRFVSVGGAIGAVLGPFVAAAVVAAIFHLLGTVVGGQQTYLQILTATAWARLPLAFQAGARLVGAALGVVDPNPDGLAGLAASGSGIDGASSPLAPPLAELSVWNLWSLALLVVATREVSRVSTRKAFAAVAAFVALKIVVGEMGVAFSRMASSFGP